MYMLFLGHLRPQKEEDVRESTWKEVIHKADVRLMRVSIDALYHLPRINQTAHSPRRTNGGGSNYDSATTEDSDYFSPQIDGEVKTDEYAYQLVIIENLDDDRVHTFEDGDPQPSSYGDVDSAGIREAVPIHELSKIFYADTGKILNIGSEDGVNSPVLLLKRDLNAIPPRRMMSRFADEDGQGYDETEINGSVQSPASNGHENSQALITSPQTRQRSSSIVSTPAQGQQVADVADPWRLPPDLDPEWIAFEVYNEAEESDTESEVETSASRPGPPSRASSLDPKMTSALSRLSMHSPSATSPSSSPAPTSRVQQQLQPMLPPIQTSLSLLETLLRLLSLQQFQQAPHLSIPDELLTFFLSESASTGAASNDVQERKRLREEARRRVGFDPYDESPVKRRGEEYQHHGREGTPQWDGEDGYRSERGYESEGYRYSPRNEDEGYDTRNWTNPSQEGRSPSTPRESNPQTPPLLLKNRSRSGTPEVSPPSPGRYAAPKRWLENRGGLRQGPADAARKGSPLARPGTGISNEVVDKSPTDEVKQLKDIA